APKRAAAVAASLRSCFENVCWKMGVGNLSLAKAVRMAWFYWDLVR
ncbi:MAG: hypothetical protein ACI920_004051, partial [Saprospiraceae bacterium]